jgi:hypothetical protein
VANNGEQVLKSVSIVIKSDQESLERAIRGRLQTRTQIYIIYIRKKRKRERKRRGKEIEKIEPPRAKSVWLVCHQRL